MRSKSFYKLRISLLNEVIARMYISFLQVHFNWCIADSASEALPKIKPRYMRGVCVYHLNRCKTSHWLFTNLQGDVAYNQGPRPTKLPDCMGYRA